MTGVGILVAKETPEALRRLERRKKELDAQRLTPMETIKTAGPCYIPAIALWTGSTACLIGSCQVNSRRNAALAAAYGISEAALREYKEKVVETIGERKEEAIRDAIAKDQVERNPPGNQTILVSGAGETLCYDSMFGRYFYSDIETLKRIENNLNRRMATMSEPYISLNEFYMEIGLETVDIGDALGWNVDRGLINLNFSSQLAQGSIPCLVMMHALPPAYDYAY